MNAFLHIIEKWLILIFVSVAIINSAFGVWFFVRQFMRYWRW